MVRILTASGDAGLTESIDVTAATAGVVEDRRALGEHASSTARAIGLDSFVRIIAVRYRCTTIFIDGTDAC